MHVVALISVGVDETKLHTFVNACSVMLGETLALRTWPHYFESSKQFNQLIYVA
jgi:hypothetical protein